MAFQCKRCGDIEDVHPLNGCRVFEWESKPRSPMFKTRTEAASELRALIPRIQRMKPEQRWDAMAGIFGRIPTQMAQEAGLV